MKNIFPINFNTFLILFVALVSLDLSAQRPPRQWVDYLNETGVAGNRHSDKDEACTRARSRAVRALRDDCEDLGGYPQGGFSEACNLSRQHGNYRQNIELSCGSRRPRREVEFVAIESAGSSQSQNTARQRARQRARASAVFQCEEFGGRVLESFIEDTECRRNNNGNHNCHATAVSECSFTRRPPSRPPHDDRFNLNRATIRHSQNTQVSGRSGPPGHPNLCPWYANVSWEVVNRNTLRVTGTTNNDCSGGWTMAIQMSPNAGQGYERGHLERSARQHGYGSELVRVSHDYRIPGPGRYELKYTHGSTGSQIVRLNIN